MHRSWVLLRRPSTTKRPMVFRSPDVSSMDIRGLLKAADRTMADETKQWGRLSARACSFMPEFTYAEVTQFLFAFQRNRVNDVRLIDEVNEYIDEATEEASVRDEVLLLKALSKFPTVKVPRRLIDSITSKSEQLSVGDTSEVVAALLRISNAPCVTTALHSSLNAKLHSAPTEAVTKLAVLLASHSGAAELIQHIAQITYTKRHGLVAKDIAFRLIAFAKAREVTFDREHVRLTAESLGWNAHVLSPEVTFEAMEAACSFGADCEALFSLVKKRIGSIPPRDIVRLARCLENVHDGIGADIVTILPLEMNRRISCFLVEELDAIHTTLRHHPQWHPEIIDSARWQPFRFS
eukprot:GEMP01034485.1.p1 GENE.GEMP01034485.1~~GEMP01034485.1.p1  ORF type:complete len:351 (+),score=67.67 GEMP01034485.1:60-1112(+)